MLRIKAGISAGRNGKDEKDRGEFLYVWVNLFACLHEHSCNLANNSKHVTVEYGRTETYIQFSKRLGSEGTGQKHFVTALRLCLLYHPSIPPSLPYDAVLTEGLWYLSELSLRKAERAIKWMALLLLQLVLWAPALWDGDSRGASIPRSPSYQHPAVSPKREDDEET